MIHEYCLTNGNDETAALLMLSFYIMQTLNIKTKPAFG